MSTQANRAPPHRPTRPTRPPLAPVPDSTARSPPGYRWSEDMATTSHTSASSTGPVPEPDGGTTRGASDETSHQGPEWQPWDTSSKVLLVCGIIAVLALVAVFVSLSFNH
jgi:hypothetical protein